MAPATTASLLIGMPRKSSASMTPTTSSVYPAMRDTV